MHPTIVTLLWTLPCQEFNSSDTPLEGSPTHTALFLNQLSLALAPPKPHSISEREGRQFGGGRVKLDMCNRFGEELEFTRYLHGLGDAGTQALFKSGQKHMA